MVKRIHRLANPSTMAGRRRGLDGDIRSSQMCGGAILASLLLTASLGAAPQDWSHGWDTLLSSQFIDFGYQPYTDAEAAFLAAHYAIVSVEKCSSPNDTESVVYENARLLKGHNPSVRTVFYWATDQQGLRCYRAHATLMANPDWWLRDDAGVVVNSSGSIPVMDYTHPDARAWWVSVPLGGDGSPQAAIIDGVLADGAGYGVSGAGCYSAQARIAAARCDALIAAKKEMVSTLQALLNNTNGGVVISNGFSYYPPPGSPADFNFGVVHDSVGVMSEHTAVFEQVRTASHAASLLKHSAYNIRSHPNTSTTYEAKYASNMRRCGAFCACDQPSTYPRIARAGKIRF